MMFAASRIDSACVHSDDCARGRVLEAVARAIEGDNVMAGRQRVLKRNHRIVGGNQRAMNENDVTAGAALVIMQPVAFRRVDVVLGKPLLGKRVCIRQRPVCARRRRGLRQHCGGV
jgi:hypothetical protein